MSARRRRNGLLSRAVRFLRRRPWTASLVLLGAALLVAGVVGLASTLAGVDAIGGLAAGVTPFVLLVVVTTCMRIGGGLSRFTEANADSDSAAPIIINAMTYRGPDTTRR